LWQVREHGKWRNSRSGDLNLAKLPLYNQTEVIRGGFLDQVIVLCKSEFSVDALTRSGIYATTRAGGASALKTNQLVAVLQDQRVLWTPDNDHAGQIGSLLVEESKKDSISTLETVNVSVDIIDSVSNRQVKKLQ
jgi:hypothetical protein